MLAKISRKNQLTLPKKIVEKMGFLEGEEKYVDVEVKENRVIMRPVTVTVEEKFSPEQAAKFRAWALDHEKDVVFDSAEKATEFLKKRIKKK